MQDAVSKDAMSTILDAAAVRANLVRVREHAARAAARAGRLSSGITIVAVTKSVGPSEARMLLDAGCFDLGENRPEALARRAAEPALARARWHMIGTYQRRKVRDTLGHVAMVHAVDSVALAEALSSRAAELGRDLDCLLQVNVSGEASKHGFAPEGARPAIDRLRTLPRLRIRGLMTMAPEDASPDECRRIFAATRALRDRLADPSLPLADLSMGMSRDFAEAILEGATFIRIGTALFRPGEGQRHQPVG
jgi:pyridoxal phosphate enzyme (YggS family)